MIAQALYASFPWYDLPEMRAATNALWDALRGALEARGWRELPAQLDRARAHGTDFAGTCVFTQTCGYPLFTTARGHFAVLGAPRYRAPGCEGREHRSYIVVRRSSPARSLEDLRGTRFAINEADSNSGMNLPRRLFAPLARDGRFFARSVLTGSHAASAELIAAGGADAAAVDCVTYALLQRYRPQAVEELRVIGETASTPTPPLVTSATTDAALFAALRAALSDVLDGTSSAAIRDALLLDGVDFCDEAAYRVIIEKEREAVLLGYPRLE